MDLPGGSRIQCHATRIQLNVMFRFWFGGKVNVKGLKMKAEVKALKPEVLAHSFMRYCKRGEMKVVCNVLVVPTIT